ncbi:SMP-30/gluconolactonase/LRE family protein [Actinophytocola sp.]|uniref:SMP-30/gluconolactonase/LRE family protein n=1 Tax=Actinophytocola sp. TaxID=1872138 RepID=UPI003D6A80BF
MNAHPLATGLGFAEGPVFTANGEIAVASIDQGVIRRLARDGTVLRTYDVGGGPNGLTEGPDGILYIAQCGAVGLSFREPDRGGQTGGVQALYPDGRVEWVTRDPIWPNDLCFGPDGFLYVTDPTRRRPNRDGGGRIWRVDITTGDAELLSSPAWYPNGIGFSHRDDELYVASTGDSRIMKLTLDDRGIRDQDTFIQMTAGKPDGFAFDVEGNTVICALGQEHGTRTPGELQTWSARGELLNTFRPGPSHHYTNAAISSDGHLLFTDSAAGEALLVENWGVPGLALHPYRTTNSPQRSHV